MESYDPKTIEAKWQERWLKENLFAASDTSSARKMYVLDMFPYPSGDGLHVGHAKIYTGADVVTRYLRMKGFNVLHPTGWDAFGLPTENSAIKFKIHPAELTRRNIDRFRGQMRRLGLSYDWEREINTTDPNYYKWTQWIFLKMFKMGLAYQDTIPINWCPKDKTGLANEEVVNGRCERCGTVVEQRPMRQWLLRITKYADRLLEGLEGLDWPSSILELQRNWIGRKEGAEILFALENSEKLPVFTTRPETVFGAMYIVLSPDHPLIGKVTSKEQKESVKAYQERIRQQNQGEIEAKEEKSGVFTGSYAIHPLNNEKIPIWIADYVLMSYGTGAIMAVPAHDERDFEFAKAHDLPIPQVVVPVEATGEVTLPYTGDGVLINSGTFDGQSVAQAKEAITQALQLKRLGQKRAHYKLKDWVFSRQRYWGEPIPIIHCEHCGIVPVPEKDLPITLPEVEHYEPTGTGESPLAAIPEWVNVKCPTCPRMAKRETNTMPQWAGSSWYWLRYASPHYQEALADPAMIQKWMPVDIYIGGAEHAVLHLLYARFWTKVLSDAGVVFEEEPFKRFRKVGLMMAEDGQKMSKSRGNVVNPDDVVNEYGADTLRVYEMFMGPFEAAVAWNTDGIRGAYRFLKRAYSLVTAPSTETIESDFELDVQVQRTIKRVSESIENFKFNTAISALMELLNSLEKRPAVSRAILEKFVLLLSPLAPHVAEELWQSLGHTQSLMYEVWPAYDERLLSQATVQLPVQVNGRVRGVLAVPVGTTQDYAEQQARSLPNVAKYLSQGEVKKVIYVPDRSLNFVMVISNG